MKTEDEAPPRVLSEREKLRVKQDEATKRAAGHLPPEMDEKTGKLINPHNPEFITRVPWYLGESGPTLKHHGDQKASYELSMEEADNLFARKIATQHLLKQNNQKVGFRKGACKNCGAMTHKEKDCMERPRSKKKSAAKTGLNIAADEVIMNLADHGKVGYSAKRDSWKGYDAEDYQENIQRYERIEVERRRLKKEEKEKQKAQEEEQRKGTLASFATSKSLKQAKHGDDSGSEIYDSDDDVIVAHGDDGRDGDSVDEDAVGISKGELLAADDQQRDFQGRMARQGGVGGNQMMVTARNLRIREDIPKYLRNLDLDSAHYDPKSRSMRANPTPHANPEDLDFAGDNFHRQTGDAVELAKAQVLAWEMQGNGGLNQIQGSGAGVDLIANPSQAALLTKQYRQDKKETMKAKKQALESKYGNASSSGKGRTAPDPRLLMGQSEAYQEYTVRGGSVVPKSTSATASSSSSSTSRDSTKYEEDVLEGNHTAVWGSYYDRKAGEWGYACCWSVLRGSYCTGEAGKKAMLAASNGLSRLLEEQRVKSEPSTTTGHFSPDAVSRKDLYGDAGRDVTLDQAKMKDALARAEKWQCEGALMPAEEGMDDMSQTRKKRKHKGKERDRPSLEGVSAEDMEAFRVKRGRSEDPMANYQDEEG